MLELLVVFALASVGVYFTTTTNAPAEGGRSDEDYYDDETAHGEDEGGIGILGIDVAGRIGRRKQARRKAEAAAARTGLPMRTGSKPDFADEGRGELEPGDDRLGDLTDDDDMNATIRSVLDDFRTDEPGATGEATGSGAAAQDQDAQSDLPGGADRLDATDQEPSLDEEDDDELNRAIRAGIAAEAAEQAADRAAAASSPAGKTAGPPVIEDFDPEEDRIVIGYRRDEAGDGRIGISEDPTWPGTARVTLGGRVVAVVPGGYGYVEAHHIELQVLDGDVNAA